MFEFIKNLLGLGGAKGYENINAAEFEKLLSETSDAVVLDVRTMGEFGSGHLPKAQNIDVTSSQFQSKIAQLDKNKTYFLYCRSGNRSGMASKILAQNGLTKLFNMSGGIGSWQGKVVK
ncbi:MAG: rhodanese-like domain-containing protein [Saprospiraceae bacterium]|nr:rhodanese-like domain-containing protein [Saprospiraceae bacterium]